MTKQKRRRVCAVGQRVNGRVYLGHSNMTKFIKNAAKIFPEKTPLMTQIQVILLLEDFYNEEPLQDGKLAWLIAISSEVEKLAKLEPADEAEAEMKKDVLGMYSQTGTFDRAKETISGLDEQVRLARAKVREAE